jgi:hypothetical protein
MLRQPDGCLLGEQDRPRPGACEHPLTAHYHRAGPYNDRMPVQRPRKSLGKLQRPASVRSGATRGKRYTFHLSLTAGEVKKLREAAAAEVRSIGNYVAHLIAKDLARDLRKERATLLSGQGRAATDVELCHEGGVGGAAGASVMPGPPAPSRTRQPNGDKPVPGSGTASNTKSSTGKAPTGRLVVSRELHVGNAWRCG